MKRLTTTCTLLFITISLGACGTAAANESSSSEAGPTTVGDGDGDETTSTEVTTGGETSEGETTGSTFVNDAEPVCGAECNIWAANDCSDGEKCTSVACEIGSTSWDSTVCRAIQGAKTLGDDCEYLGSGIDGNDDCDDGLMCWNQDADTMLGTCVAFCEGSPTAASCAEGTTCVIANDGNLPVCLSRCDPLAQDCDKSNELCLPDFDQTGFVCVLDASGGMAPYGTPCNFANSCNQGLICIAPEAVPEAACATAAGCCSPMCDLNEATSCPGQGQQCESLYEPGNEPPGFEHMGVCAVPA